jgi:Outer membrane protein beta-barrel domain
MTRTEMQTLLRTLRMVSALSLLAAATPLGAQGLGFTLGKTQSDVVSGLDAESSSYPNRYSYTAGVTYGHLGWPGIMVRPELLLVQRGWSEDNHPTLSLTYVEIPVLLRFGAVSQTGWPVRPVFTLGSSVAVLAHCSLTNLDLTTAEGGGCSERIVRPFVEDYGINRVDVGLIFGLGLDMRISGTVIGVEGRFEWGLTDIRRESERKQHNSTLFLLLNVTPQHAP